jgi:RNase P/RNase MRP subunit POP5
MKRKIPAERKSQRYIKFKIHSDTKHSLSDIVEEFWSSVHSYMGSKDASQAEPWLIANKFSRQSQEGVIRVNRGFEDDLRTSLILIDEIQGEDVFLSTQDVSGTLKKLD